MVKPVSRVVKGLMLIFETKQGESTTETWSPRLDEVH
jgi:hypothetical protein